MSRRRRRPRAAAFEDKREDHADLREQRVPLGGRGERDVGALDRVRGAREKPCELQRAIDERNLSTLD